MVKIPQICVTRLSSASHFVTIRGPFTPKRDMAAIPFNEENALVWAGRENTSLKIQIQAGTSLRRFQPDSLIAYISTDKKLAKLVVTSRRKCNWISTRNAKLAARNSQWCYKDSGKIIISTIWKLMSTFPKEMSNIPKRGNISDKNINNNKLIFFISWDMEQPLSFCL